jgi:hypothetical protein
MQHVVAPMATHVWVSLKATAVVRMDGVVRHPHTVEAVASLALETAAATPAQDPAQSKAALARLPQQPHHQQHLDLLSNA